MAKCDVAMALALFLFLWSSPALAQTCGQDTMGHVYCYGPSLEVHGRVDEGGHALLHEAGGRAIEGQLHGGGHVRDGQGRHWIVEKDQFGNGSAYDGRSGHLQCHVDTMGHTVCY